MVSRKESAQLLSLIESAYSTAFTLLSWNRVLALNRLAQGRRGACNEQAKC
jgi:hypothetical protein